MRFDILIELVLERCVIRILLAQINKFTKDIGRQMSDN